MQAATTFERLSIWGVLGVAIAGLIYAALLMRQILAEDQGNEKMQQVAQAIREGAIAYLNRQFRTIVIFVGVLTVVLYVAATFAKTGQSIAIGRAAAFLMGSFFSLAVGQVGMRVAVLANVRVASASQRSFRDALRIAYRSGTVSGMLTDGLGLLGGTIIFLIYGEMAPGVLLGFGFGGTLLALFMRVGGGIYTKAADIGADLVGKIEKGIPEDDPRNAAVIADLVGDNVGDCAGMAADVFESYEVTIVAAMILGLAIQPFHLKWIVFPLLVRAIGVIASIVGTYTVGASSEERDAFGAIKRGFNISAAISIISIIVLALAYVGDWRLGAVTFAGVILAVTINYLTEYYTSTDKPPVRRILQSTKTGPATTILTGMAIGLESSVWAVLVIAITIVFSVLVFRDAPEMILYGVALCGIGQLTLTGNNVSMDAFGPIADNASGIGEMSGLDADARQIMADLDAVGNTTKAVTKGIAIASAVIAAVSLFGAFADTVQAATGGAHLTIDITNPYVFVGMLIGGAIPFLFSSMTIDAVGRAAYLIVHDVREQFRVPGVLQGTVKPDYARVVNVCTTAAQRELLRVGVLAIASPVIVGFLLREAAVGGFLAGVILSGQLMAVFMVNAGGAWDNAKKLVEDGHMGGRRSEAHHASIVGDMVGDPLKDTAGPALNPLIKVINLISVIIAPLFVQVSGVTGWIIAAAGLALVAFVVRRGGANEQMGK